MLGGVLGLTVHAGAAALGLSALLLASATAFTVLKIVGAVYLLWLAAQMLWSAARSLAAGGRARPVRRRPRGGRRTCGRASCPTRSTRRWRCSSSPSCPSSSPPTAAPAAEALLLSAVFAALYLAWFGLYVAAVDRLGRWLRRPRVKARIEQVTGLVLVAVAVKLVTSHQLTTADYPASRVGRTGNPAAR